MTQRRVFVAMAAAIGGIAIVAAFLQQSAVGPGPLAQAAESLDIVPVDIGQALSFGQVMLNNPTTDVATIQAITLLDPTPGLELVALKVFRRGDPPINITGTALGYPPPDVPSDRLIDPTGAEVHPETTDKPWAEQVEILVGLRAPTAGQFGITGFR